MLINKKRKLSICDDALVTNDDALVTNDDALVTNNNNLCSNANELDRNCLKCNTVCHIYYDEYQTLTRDQVNELINYNTEGNFPQLHRIITRMRTQKIV